MMHILGDVTSRIGEFDRVRYNTPFLQVECILLLFFFSDM